MQFTNRYTPRRASNEDSYFIPFGEDKGKFVYCFVLSGEQCAMWRGHVPNSVTMEIAKCVWHAKEVIINGKPTREEYFERVKET